MDWPGSKSTAQLRSTNQPEDVGWTSHLLCFTLRTDDHSCDHSLFHKIPSYLGWRVVFWLYKWLVLWLHLRKPQRLGEIGPGVSGSPCPHTRVLWNRTDLFCQEDFDMLLQGTAFALFFLHQSYYFLERRLWWAGLSLLGKQRRGAGLDQEDLSKVLSTDWPCRRSGGESRERNRYHGGN